MDDDDSVRLDELTKDEFFRVVQGLRPDISEDEYDVLWRRFQDEKARRRLS